MLGGNELHEGMPDDIVERSGTEHAKGGAVAENDAAVPVNRDRVGRKLDERTIPLFVLDHVLGLEGAARGFFVATPLRPLCLVIR
jgi:hypothetical protein